MLTRSGWASPFHIFWRPRGASWQGARRQETTDCIRNPEDDDWDPPKDRPTRTATLAVAALLGLSACGGAQQRILLEPGVEVSDARVDIESGSVCIESSGVEVTAQAALLPEPRGAVPDPTFWITVQNNRDQRISVRPAEVRLIDSFGNQLEPVQLSLDQGAGDVRYALVDPHIHTSVNLSFGWPYYPIYPYRGWGGRGRFGWLGYGCYDPFSAFGPHWLWINEFGATSATGLGLTGAPDEIEVVYSDARSTYVVVFPEVEPAAGGMRLIVPEVDIQPDGEAGELLEFELDLRADHRGLVRRSTSSNGWAAHCWKGHSEAEGAVFPCFSFDPCSFDGDGSAHNRGEAHFVDNETPKKSWLLCKRLPLSRNKDAGARRQGSDRPWARSETPTTTPCASRFSRHWSVSSLIGVGSRPRPRPGWRSSVHRRLVQPPPQALGLGLRIAGELRSETSRGGVRSLDPYNASAKTTLAEPGLPLLPCTLGAAEASDSRGGWQHREKPKRSPVHQTGAGPITFRVPVSAALVPLPAQR